MPRSKDRKNLNEKRITFIHPEGNFNSNPHLGAVLEHLCDNGYVVDVYVTKRSISQAALHPAMQVHFQPELYSRLITAISRLWFGILPARLLCLLAYPRFRSNLIIGVDTDGMIIAAHLGQLKRRPTAYFSYEIIFAAEAGKFRKRAEINACRNISFAVVQDQVRGTHLARENQIAIGKLVYMPVAAAGASSAQPGWLRQKLGIQSDKKIALLMGSLEKWCGLNEILDSLPKWPDDWCLVIHGRDGLNNSEIKGFLDSHPTRIFVSSEPFETDRDLGAMLGDVDLGLAFYYPDYSSIWTGRNLKYVGLASGKIATFLRFGVPVMVNQIGEMANHVEHNRLGHVVNAVADIPAILEAVKSKDGAAVERCQSFFDESLSASATMRSLMTQIDVASTD
jgi:hypothetical protein